MNAARAAAGGGRIVEVEPRRVPGWLTRFADRNGSYTCRWSDDYRVVVATAANGTTATLEAPFGPARQTDDEPVEDLLAHIDALEDLALILVRERAFSVGIARGGVVQRSSTDTRYVQSRTAAGGWSQQRYARRRGNQRASSFQAAADTAHRVLNAHRGSFSGVVVGGTRAGMDAVIGDPRLAALAALPRRVFPDIAEPRRAVLGEIAARALWVPITIKDG